MGFNHLLVEVGCATQPTPRASSASLHLLRCSSGANGCQYQLAQTILLFPDKSHHVAKTITTSGNPCIRFLTQSM